MHGVTSVTHEGNTIALILKKTVKVKGLQFLTESSNPLQVGIHNQEKGTLLPSHIHQVKNLPTINKIQEILIVKKGKIRVILSTKEGVVIAKKILRDGDSILIMDLGHGVEFLEDSEVLMIKQGPYQDGIHQKIYLKKNDSRK